VNIHDIFQPYTMPPASLQVRCHVLQDDKMKLLEDYMVQQLPDCYISSECLKDHVNKTGMSASEIIANKLPDPGSVMSGDFGELLTLFFLSAEHAEKTVLIKKWRYKQDRLKAAPYSDVLIICCEFPKKPSAHDYIICAETKQKATSSNFVPIQEAIKGYEKDKTGRLARALAWLREKAIDHGSQEEIELLNRFTIDLSIGYVKYFKAVVIIDRALLDEEITKKIDIPAQSASFEVVALGINALQRLYETVFFRAIREVKA
jgi:hypothetical protein